MKTFLILLAVLSFNFSSAHADPVVDANGIINSVETHLHFGHAKVFTQNGESKIMLNLYNGTATDLCNTFPPGDFQMYMGFPAALGSFGVSNSGQPAYAVMNDYRERGAPSNNNIAPEGNITITAISATEVSGTFNAKSDFFHCNMSGSFQVPICK
jgi:hypothetical protein